MATCDPPEIVFPECDLDLSYTGCDLELWEAAETLLESARCIADAGDCADLYKCSEGNWGLGVNDTQSGVTVGQIPTVDDCCCGSITVTSLMDDLADGTETDCYRAKNSLVAVKLTWPCGTHAFKIALERSRFCRLLPDVFCCKQEVGAKEKKMRLSLETIDEDPGDDCPSLLLTFRVQ